jgi:sugar lactone lactonase YvrE
VAGIAAANRDLWIAVDGNRIARIDGATGAVEQTLRVARRKLFELGDAGFIAVVGDSVWLTVPKLGTEAPHALWRIDADTGTVREKHKIGVNPTPPLVVGRELWFVTLDRGLVRYDTASGRYEAIPAGDRPWAYTRGAGSVWVGHELPGQVRRINPETGRTIATIDTDPKVRGLGFGGGFVWVATETSLRRIDPKRNRVTRTTDITSRHNDEGPVGVAYVNGDVWVSVE